MSGLGGADRPFRVVVSACLAGRSVRWDGGHERRDFLTAVLAPRAQILEICPEVEAGMPVPREPIQLVRAPAGFRLYGVESKRELGPALLELVHRRLPELAAFDPDAFLLKGRSPSCGLDGARVFETREDLLAPDGPWTRDGRGLFAAAVLGRFPDRLVVDETYVETREGQRRFVKTMAAMREARRRKSPGEPGPAHPPAGPDEKIDGQPEVAALLGAIDGPAAQGAGARPAG